MCSQRLSSNKKICDPVSKSADHLQSLKRIEFNGNLVLNAGVTLPSADFIQINSAVF